MALKSVRKNFFEDGINQKKVSPKKLSLDLHTMPKTETGHFKKWLVLALLIFVLIILGLLFFL